ncbi:MAG: radical SAM protein [Candidatus Marinimicrobia bacterium]|nr:radical SAM protein [Candidatus Neomarinimicrobiota bacterium]MCF7827741.1 radical SAM protein [Candidatus Neomarinimicrobiota bacterium]MCF7881459.1 radical SAM protein [Candidatus Neomarinimicrobiota bacterium]
MPDSKNSIEEKSAVLFKAKPYAFSVSIDIITSYSFDRKGRLIGAYVDGINYKRGLDNSVLMKWTDYSSEGQRRRRRKLSDDERKDFFQRMTRRLTNIKIHSERYNIEMPEGTDIAWEWFNRCLAYDFEALEADADQFHKVYKPVTILPPDQYYSLVLQITEGCSYNKCTFCNFYQDRPFRIKSPEAVEGHIHGVNDFFGESIGLRQSIFLADANAVIMPQERLLKILRLIHEHYTIIADNERKREVARRRRNGEVIFDGIYSFIDLFTGEYKSASQFREMADHGVQRVYIGMESGSEALLQFLQKPGSKSEMVDAVNNIKAGGVNVGVIILIGAGGKKYQRVHVEHTIDAVNRMNLDADDFIYFSDFYPQDNTSYQDVAKEAGIEALSWHDRRAQEQQIREGLRYRDPKTGPMITRYDIREFLY